MIPFAQAYFAFVQSVRPESRLRLAPTPSGFLHLGNALNFALNWLAARAHHASLALRIDDLDTDRKRPEYVEDIFDSLEWLGLDWDAPPVFQSENQGRYHDMLAKLRALDLLFACQKSRRELAPFHGAYPLEFRQQNRSLDTPDTAWRIRTDDTTLPASDFVVRRRDGIPAYQVASFADDLQLGITHIIRGADLEDSTAAQLFLGKALSEEKFLAIRFLHHPLVLGDDGEKLSKSAGAASLRARRLAGESPQIVYRTLGQWLGLDGDSAQALLVSLRRHFE